MFDQPGIYDTLFSIASNLAMVGWAGLALLPMVDLVVKVIARWAIPGLIALLHAALLVTHWSLTPEGAGLSTIDGLQKFFSVDGLMLVGWVHFLAWDLFAGSWMVEDSRRIGIHHLLIVPCLAVTFMFGPSGLLLYIPLRFIGGHVIARRQGAAA